MIFSYSQRFRIYYSWLLPILFIPFYCSSHSISRSFHFCPFNLPNLFRERFVTGDIILQISTIINEIDSERDCFHFKQVSIEMDDIHQADLFKTNNWMSGKASSIKELHNEIEMDVSNDDKLNKMAMLLILLSCCAREYCEWMGKVTD